MIHRHEDTVCYSKEYVWMVIALMQRGRDLFYKSPAIKNCDRINDIYSQSDKLVDIKSYHSISLLNDFFLDPVYIVAAFDNIAKALLRHYGYVVHFVDKSVECHASLASKQRKEPLEIDELLSFEKKYHGNTNDKFIHTLDDKSINLSFIISKSKYYKSIGWDENVVKQFKELVKERNRQIHSYTIWWAKDLPKLISFYNNLKRYIEDEVVHIHNALVSKSGYPESWIMEKEDKDVEKSDAIF